MRRASILRVKWRERTAFWLPALLVVALDQLSKFLVRANMLLEQSIPSDGVVRLTYVSNYGGVFGLFAGHTLPLILVGAAGVVAILFCYFYLASQRRLLSVGLGLILGGAIGNMVDRLRFGCVTDFIDIRIWPVFNLADSAGVVGVGIIAYFLLFSAREKKR